MKKIIDNFIKYRFLLLELIKKGIKLRYRRSYLGIIWTLLEPLLMTIVLYFVFGTLLGRNSTDAMPYAVYILVGRLCFSYFSTATRSCLKSIRSNAGMIKKVYVPKYLYPLSEALYNYIIFLISLIILVLTCLVLGVFPKFSWLLAIAPLIVLFLLSFGVGMILATIGVFFRDMEYLWTVVNTLIMYMSAIFYYPEQLFTDPNDWRFLILKLNPLYDVIANFRACISGETFHTMYFLYSLAFSLTCCAVGIYFFFKKQDKFILEI